MLLDILEGTFFTFEFDLRGGRSFLGVSRLENHEIAGPGGWVWAVDSSFGLFRERAVHVFMLQFVNHWISNLARAARQSLPIPIERKLR